MDPAQLKQSIAANIAACRKAAGMTQAELAEKLNYSDKAVSTWERGESLPDVPTLVLLSEVLHTPVDVFLHGEQQPLPETEPAGEEYPEAPKKRVDKNVIVGLCALLVIFIALLGFVVMHYCRIPGKWLCFVVAIPVMAIVLLSVLSAFRKFRWNRLLISAIVWGCLLLFFCIFRTYAGVSLWAVFWLGVPGQAAVWLWFRLFK